MVEAGVGAWQHIAVLSVTAYIKLNCAETIDGCTITSCRERKELFALFIVEVFVNDFPKPLSLQTLFSVTFNETAVLLPSMKI